MTDKVCWLLTSDKLVEGTPKLANFASISHLLQGTQGLILTLEILPIMGMEEIGEIVPVQLKSTIRTRTS